jgi:hypothetical protein
MKKRKTHPRIGSPFEDFLRDEGRFEEATAVAVKRVLARKVEKRYAAKTANVKTK